MKESLEKQEPPLIREIVGQPTREDFLPTEDDRRAYSKIYISDALSRVPTVDDIFIRADETGRMLRVCENK